MNPLIPINAIQIRYTSPIYEPIYDDDEHVIDEECIREGTDILHECIVAVSNDKLPRYYRLRYRENAKDHKQRWVCWLDNNLINGRTPYFVKVKKIGRRVLFEFDETLIEKREKKLRAIQHKKDLKARKLARQVAPGGYGPRIEESWDEQRISRATAELWRTFEQDDDLEDNPDRYIGESEQGEAVYEDRESGDRYEER